MNKDKAPFEVGEEVVCINDSPALNSGQKHFIKGAKYIIEEIEFRSGQWKVYFEKTTNEFLGWWRASRFRRNPPSYSNIAKELAEKACEPVIEIDQPAKKMKEPALN